MKNLSKVYFFQMSGRNSGIYASHVHPADAWAGSICFRTILAQLAACESKTGGILLHHRNMPRFGHSSKPRFANFFIFSGCSQQDLPTLTYTLNL